MKVVIDTSPVVWLNKIGRLGLLSELYDDIYTTPLVLDELNTFRDVPSEFLDTLQVPEGILNDRARFDRLVRRWQRRLDNRIEETDIGVFVAYNSFVDDPDEMLFANKNATENLGRRGTIRELADLYELAEEKGLYKRKESIAFIKDLAALPYRTSYLETIKQKLRI